MKIGFIGTGNMGGAIIKGYLAVHDDRRKDVLAIGKNKEKLADFCRELGIESREDIGQLVADSDIIVIGVKPNMFETVLPEINEAYNPNKVLVSIAAGISISFMEGFIYQKPAKIVRAMPNTPAMVNEGMTSLSKNDAVTVEEFRHVMEIFTSVGKAEEVAEDLIDAVVGVSGSSPAYTYMYIEALIDGAVKNGMAKEQARTFAAQTVLGAARMVLETDVDTATLRENVCSPGGITIEAVKTLQENGFQDKVAEAFESAVRKSKIMKR